MARCVVRLDELVAAEFRVANRANRIQHGIAVFDFAGDDADGAYPHFAIFFHRRRARGLFLMGARGTFTFGADTLPFFARLAHFFFHGAEHIPPWSRSRVSPSKAYR